MKNILAVFVLLIVLTNDAYGMNTNIYLETPQTNRTAYLESAFCVASFIMGTTNVIRDYQLAALISCDVQDVHDTCLLMKNDFVYDVLKHTFELLLQKQECHYFFLHNYDELEHLYYVICQDENNHFKICDYNLTLYVYDEKQMQSTHNNFDYGIKNTLHNTGNKHHDNDADYCFGPDWFI